MKNSSITIITAVYNSAQFLRQMVESVGQQKLPPVEHLIVDDCSTDNSLSLAKELEIEFPLVRVVSLPKNVGYPAALNLGINEATSEFIGILDSDDIAMPNWLECVLPVLERNLGVGLVGGGCVIMTVDGLVTGHVKYCEKEGDVTFDVSNGNYPILHPGCVHRRSVILNAGGYNPLLRSLEDSDMFLNVASISRIFNVGIPLIYYRRLPGSESRKTQEYTALAKEFLHKKAMLLSMGRSISDANAELSSIIVQFPSVPRLAPTIPGEYEHEMAGYLRRNGQQDKAFRYYLESARVGFKRFLSCRRAFCCLFPMLKIKIKKIVYKMTPK